MSLSQDRPAGTASPASLIDYLATSEQLGRHTFGDARRTVSYAEVPAILDRLDELFARHGVRPNCDVALECSQSVAGALAILYVLHRGYDVVLLPKLNESASKESGTQRSIPSFCTHVITATEEAIEDTKAFPEGRLRVTANEGYASEPAIAGFEGPDLYLRTSGSTGVAKLARMSHQKWLDNAWGCVERWGLEARDRLSVPVPIFHSYGFGAAFLPGLLVGASMDLISSFNILRYLEREERFAPNVAFLTPALCDMFVKVRKSPRPYKLAVTAGDKIRQETVAAFGPRFGALLNLYGSAEMGAVSSASPEDPPEQRLGTAGYALAGIELYVEAGEVAPYMAAGNEAAGGEAGKLYCRQTNGFAGYLVQEETGWRFAPLEDAFETGDLARIRDDGYLQILGRAGLSVKRDGLWVVPAEVEAVIEGIEGCARAVAVTGGESRRGARIVVFCVAEESAGATAEQLREQCFERLPRYAVPDEVVMLDSVPLLPSGKVNRRALRERAKTVPLL